MPNTKLFTSLRLLVFCFSLSAYSLCFSQEIIFTNYSTKEGLPSPEVYDVYQDVNGLMWFATDRGISNFDGFTFQNLGLEDKLTCSTVFKFFPQENGEIWCSTYNGKLFYFHPDDYVIHPYKYNEVIGKFPNSIPGGIFLDKNNSLHLGFTSLLGILTIDDKGNILEKPKKYPAGILEGFYFCLKQYPNDHFISFLEYGKPKASKDLLSISTDICSGNYSQSFANKNVRILLLGTNAHIFKGRNDTLKISADKKVLRAGMYDSDHFWLGFSKGGVVVYDMNGTVTDHFLQNESVTGLTRDQNGCTWVTTLRSGVFYNSNHYFRKYNLSCEGNIANLSLTERGQLLMGTTNGELIRISKNSQSTLYLEKTKEHKVEANYYHPLATTLVMNGFNFFDLYTKETVLDGYWAGLSNNSNHLPIVYCRNRISLQKINGEWKHYRPSGTFIHCTEYGTEGIYYGTNTGLFLLDTLTGISSQVFPDVLNSRVSDIHFSKGKLVIIGTLGKGIFILNHGQLTHISRKDGLTNDFVTKIFVQKEDVFWACTNEGLNRIKLTKNGYVIDQILQQDGLIDKDVVDVVVSNDTAYVATRSGLCSFSLDFLSSKDERAENYFLSITGTFVNGKPKPNLTELSHYENNIQLDYRAVHFKPGSTLNFRYKLIGFNANWNYTNDRSILFQTLPPGNYQLLIQAGTANNWSSDYQTVSFTILPPFYQTNWFYILVISTVITIIYLFFRFQVLSYNRDIIRELLRQFLKRIKRKSPYFIVRENGQEVKILSKNVLYIKSSDNYIEIHTVNGKTVVREKISNFLDLVPDPIEYIRIQRSYIIRLDRIEKKSKKSVQINGVEIRVGTTYQENFSAIHL
ncbi:MAG: triple tyrosine motif-containing protein [Crocinitomicaceae bacterium]